MASSHRRSKSSSLQERRPVAHWRSRSGFPARRRTHRRGTAAPGGALSEIVTASGQTNRRARHSRYSARQRPQTARHFFGLARFPASREATSRPLWAHSAERRRSSSHTSRLPPAPRSASAPWFPIARRARLSWPAITWAWRPSVTPLLALGRCRTDRAGKRHRAKPTAIRCRPSARISAPTRVDQNFSDKDTLAAVYTMDDSGDHTPSANPLSLDFETLREQVASAGGDARLFAHRAQHRSVPDFPRLIFLHRRRRPSTFRDGSPARPSALS